MAISLITPINQLCFLSELDRLVISAQGEESVSLSISKGDCILQNVYIPDDDDMVTVYDISRVIEAYLDLDNPAGNVFTFLIGTSLTVSTTVVPCSVDVNETAQVFAVNHFMTPMMAARDTCVGRYETLTAYVPSGTPYAVDATYYKDGGLAVRHYDFTTTIHAGPIDVSPGLFVDGSLGALIAYEVTCGQRKASYHVRKSMPEADPAIFFRNCFGCWETLYLTGAKTQQPKFTRSSAVIDGRFKVYDIMEEMAWEARTGPLRAGMESVATDLARSRSVYVLKADGEVSDEIMITDCDVKMSNDGVEMPDFKFTFRRAASRSSMIEIPRPPRVFDHTFDTAFR